MLSALDRERLRPTPPRPPCASVAPVTALGSPSEPAPASAATIAECTQEELDDAKRQIVQFVAEYTMGEQHLLHKPSFDLFAVLMKPADPSMCCDTRADASVRMALSAVDYHFEVLQPTVLKYLELGRMIHCQNNVCYAHANGANAQWWKALWTTLEAGAVAVTIPTGISGQLLKLPRSRRTYGITYADTIRPYTEHLYGAWQTQFTGTPGGFQHPYRKLLKAPPWHWTPMNTHAAEYVGRSPFEHPDVETSDPSGRMRVFEPLTVVGHTPQPLGLPTIIRHKFIAQTSDSSEERLERFYVQLDTQYSDRRLNGHCLFVDRRSQVNDGKNVPQFKLVGRLALEDRIVEKVGEGDDSCGFALSCVDEGTPSSFGKDATLAYWASHTDEADGDDQRYEYEHFFGNSYADNQKLADERARSGGGDIFKSVNLNEEAQKGRQQFADNHNSWSGFMEKYNTRCVGMGRFNAQAARSRDLSNVEYTDYLIYAAYNNGSKNGGIANNKTKHRLVLVPWVDEEAVAREESEEEREEEREEEEDDDDEEEEDDEDEEEEDDDDEEVSEHVSEDRAKVGVPIGFNKGAVDAVCGDLEGSVWMLGHYASFIRSRDVLHSANLIVQAIDVQNEVLDLEFKRRQGELVDTCVVTSYCALPRTPLQSYHTRVVCIGDVVGDPGPSDRLRPNLWKRRLGNDTPHEFSQHATLAEQTLVVGEFIRISQQYDLPEIRDTDTHVFLIGNRDQNRWRWHQNKLGCYSEMSSHDVDVLQDEVVKAWANARKNFPEEIHGDNWKRTDELPYTMPQQLANWLSNNPTLWQLLLDNIPELDFHPAVKKMKQSVVKLESEELPK